MLSRFFSVVFNLMDLSSSQVYLQHCQNYDEKGLLDIFDQIIVPCLGDKNLRSSGVLLKPNLITARMGPLACTDTRFILAAAKWFLAKGAKVSIGDSPAFGTTKTVLKKLGALDQLKQLPVQLTNFKKSRDVVLRSGITARLAVDALDCDMLVNMPRVKAHAQLRVSLAVKNLFGCLVGMRKPWWHMRYGGCNGGFSSHLIELLSVLPSGVTLVDGIIGMHRTGPITGEHFPLHVTCCSTNPVAMDRAILAMIGVSPEKSPLMFSSIHRKLNGTYLDSLEFPLLTSSELAVDTFVVPEELHPIRFDPFRFLGGNIRRMFHKLGLFS